MNILEKLQELNQTNKQLRFGYVYSITINSDGFRVFKCNWYGYQPEVPELFCETEHNLFSYLNDEYRTAIRYRDNKGLKE